MKKLFIANWKMNLGMRQTLSLIEKVNKLPQKKFDLVLAPSFPMLVLAKKHSQLDIASQDCAAWEKGSYTGEVSAKTIKEIGAKFAIVGHSERRKYLAETDELINQKINQAWQASLVPVLCFGENAEQVDKREQVIVNQLKNDFNKLKPNSKNEIIFAYEPVWAIGTGENCSVDIVLDVYRIVKRVAVNMFGSKFFDQKTKFLYGGSVNSKNIKDYIKEKNVKGVLVGKTSINIGELKKIFR